MSSDYLFESILTLRKSTTLNDDVIRMIVNLSKKSAKEEEKEKEIIGKLLDFVYEFPVWDHEEFPWSVICEIGSILDCFDEFPFILKETQEKMCHVVKVAQIADNCISQRKLSCEYLIHDLIFEVGKLQTYIHETYGKGRC